MNKLGNHFSRGSACSNVARNVGESELGLHIIVVIVVMVIVVIGYTQFLLGVWAQLLNGIRVCRGVWLVSCKPWRERTGNGWLRYRMF